MMIETFKIELKPARTEVTGFWIFKDKKHYPAETETWKVSKEDGVYQLLHPSYLDYWRSVPAVYISYDPKLRLATVHNLPDEKHLEEILKKFVSAVRRLEHDGKMRDWKALNSKYFVERELNRFFGGR